ncbi:MAG: symmetrical bis(5'-nucleosyl)-tetraphosphatase [Deltaproteobacteria bacterium HGW-Deltaproteobacteria-14]|nr:MAG: symmetrical bis(5'-nucleosyl)-tetraphosphatase [Deltaproteobacteria bacterium HGW-Deltaproteobacteria-14]
MATYAIGDIQGCYEPLMRLLGRVAFDPEVDRLWIVGDLVNRGPSSLRVLRWMVEHERAVVAVLGNHDVHLLARHAGVAKASRDDTLDGILEAHDADVLVAWLARRPLAHREDDRLMVHAGLLPSWTPEAALALAREIEEELRGPDRAKFLADLYRDKGRRFDAGLGRRERRLAAAAVLTRLRAVDADGQMVARFKGPPEELGRGQVPWFRAPGRASGDVTLIFGHWATLGLWLEERVMALDTGCVWGGSLTAVRLEDRAVFSVPALR